MATLIKTIFGKKTNVIPEYGSLNFDHLQAELLLEANSLTPEEKNICSEIQKKREENLLTWDEIYTYHLILLKYYDFETLKSKVISLRQSYQSLADTAEYADYITLRSVDIPTITNKEDNLDKLRADYKYLVNEF